MVLMNGPTWFQTAYYMLVIFFPSIDATFRQCSLKQIRHHMLWMTGVSTFILALPLFIGLFFLIFILNFSFVSWLPLFSLAVAFWHHFERANHGDNKNNTTTTRRRRVWGVVTDMLSLVFLGVLILNAFSDCSSRGGVISCERWTYEQWRESDDFQHGGRWNNLIGAFWGFFRLNT